MAEKGHPSVSDAALSTREVAERFRAEQQAAKDKQDKALGAEAERARKEEIQAVEQQRKDAQPKHKGLVQVRATQGELRHLFTNTVFTTDPKKVEVDAFLQAQLDAGKLEIIED